MQLAAKLPSVGTTIFSVMSQLAAEHRAVNLGQGFPDFEPPEELKAALSRALADGKHQYAPAPGVLKLREQIALKIRLLYGARVDPETEVTVTSGATEALFAAIAATVHTGDEVIILDPSYDSYAPAIELQGALAVRVPLRVPSFSIDWDRLRDAITEKTRLIIINTPHNPTGAVLDGQDHDLLAELVRGRNIFILSDEVYEHIVFDGEEHQSILRHPELAERSFAVSSFGKTYHCTGWKLGYAVAPKALSAEFRKIHQYLTFSSFTPAQWALAEMLHDHPQHYLNLPDFYRERRDYFRRLLQPSRFKLLPVRGAYFQLADYSEIRDVDDVAFCDWLVRESGVAAIPLTPFYGEPPGTRLVRFCFAKNDATLEAAAERLCRL